ncbi:MAG: hypothetical protein GOMPHAMPRED_003296 [Gomphillus americanus]|uniref:G-patch domain-containing protein n=1 Tax=Gomphillus americanus TaxID=1940652 RepID=A0A8H3EMK5_9LECA|nr:MAG: hypothetical protein GOMPHAMPRED_003296 [Gomphillus americanus]
MAGKRNRARFEEDLQAIQSPYVIYGTPLPPLDANVRDDGSFVPIWKQEVTDERGRKRLHGAFTGGFSAGYFNTVGSKEGWTPTAFVSSKSNRWKDSGSKLQAAEDLMDDEDKQEAEEARQVSTKSGFAGLGSTENEVKKRAPLMDLFRSSDDTMGLKLLRKMGWKDGQGIGPRVWRVAVLDDGTSTSGPGAEKHLFAPPNSKLVLIVRKDDRRGLGYEVEGTIEKPVSRSIVQSDDEDAGLDSKLRKPAAKKGAFGVGVLNDTGSDDEDPFSLGPKISYSKVLGGNKKKRKKTDLKSGSNSNPLLGSRPVFISHKANKSLAGFRKCHDGRLPLEGFILSVSKVSTESNKYPPPKVPDNWQPSKQKSEVATDLNDWQSSATLAKSSTLEPLSRGSILGEAPLPGKSVFDFMKPQARDRLVAITKNETLPPARSESAPIDPSISDPASSILPLDPAIASSALGRGVSGFVPYTDNPPKLARYRAYLSYSAGLTTEIPTRPPDLASDEWLREMHEFANAATIFKPMTGSIATRFTTATSASLQQNQSPLDNNNEPPSLTTTIPKDTASEAAAISMFGHLTRSSTLFYPTRLLCKRFNVPVPTHVHTGNEGTSSTNNNNKTTSSSPFAANPIIPSSSRFESTGYQTTDSHGRIQEITSEEQKQQQQQQHKQGHKQEQKQQADKEDDGSGDVKDGKDLGRNPALEQERPADEVFRAIFGSDSESEDG